MTRPRLTLVAARREIESQMAGRKHEQQFLDFVIEGEPLYPGIRDRGLDVITPIWINDDRERSASVDAVHRLLGLTSTDFPDGRVSVYVCPECRQPGCGAMTVRLKVTSEVVTWNAWGWQTDYSDDIGREGLEALGDLTFARTQYDEAFRAALEQLNRARLI